MKHTPGPWELWFNDAGGFVIGQPKTAIICQRSDWDHRAKESIANARLIAAAPDLLAYAKLMSGYGDPDAIGLVAQAEGSVLPENT